MAVVYSSTEKHLWNELKQRPLKEELFITPTDTIYGFGAAYSYKEGARRICRLKKRLNQQFIVLVNSVEQAKTLCEISPAQEKILKQYWPGAISFILKAKNEEKTLALRLPENKFICEFIENVGEPIISTSCNEHGKEPAVSAIEALSGFPKGVDFVIDGGRRQNLTPSTLVDLTSDPPTVLRSGVVSFH